jgi:para-aminobenzoate synthetase component I
MKGTIDAMLPDAEKRLMDDPKELAEHYTIVDLLRNDLNMVSQKVRVNRFRYVEEIHTHRGRLLQTSSDISGILPNDYQQHLGDIMARLLPAGSVSGAPKKKTVEIIHSAENYERGFYTGVFGVFDGRTLDSAVMIRFIEKTANGLVFKAGGGITVNSRIEDEYQEMLQKVYLPLHRKME